LVKIVLKDCLFCNAILILNCIFWPLLLAVMWTGYVDVKGMVQCITQLCHVLVDVNTQSSIFYSSVVLGHPF